MPKETGYTAPALWPKHQDPITHGGRTGQQLEITSFTS